MTSTRVRARTCTRSTRSRDATRISRSAPPPPPPPPPPPIGVDEAAARHVAADFLAGGRPVCPSLVRAAYEQLVTQTDALLLDVTERWWPSLRIVTTAVAEPYATARELIDAVRTTDVLEIPPPERGRGHAVLRADPGGEHDRVRALHDLVGHVLPGFGFDRDGECSAWRRQDRLHHGPARWALATELHAHHSVRWTTGEVAEPRAVLVDPRLLRASLGARATAPVLP